MIQQTQTTSFKAELYEGIHDLLTDEIKVALYTALANLNQDTTEYTTTYEVASGNGYSTGGEVAQNVTVNSSGYTAYVSFDNITWDPASFTCRGALIYNATKNNRSIAVLDFGTDKTATNTFTFTLPANTADSALIRSSN